MERKIVKKIGNLEMDDKGVVYKTTKGGFQAPPLPEEYKIPYPAKPSTDGNPVCGVYPSEIEYAYATNEVDQMNAQKELDYQTSLKADYQALRKIYRRQERKRITRQSVAFILKAMRSYREYRR